ncbi:MAG: type II toxin-antitoxin system Phd/YefM family antitoxin [Sphingomonadaceae bacterium]
MKIEIGSDEAKARLSELIRGVQQGHRYTLTLRGAAVAELVPADASAVATVSAAVAQMQRFIASQPPMYGVDTKTLIEQGRD